VTSIRLQHAIGENSMQQLDPLGTLTARPITVVACIAAPLLAIALTVQQRDEMVYPIVSAAAVLALVAACIILVLASEPVSAPLTGFTNGLVLALGALGATLEAIGHWQYNRYLSDDWGPIAMGILLLATCPYRPVGKLLQAGVSATGFVAVLALIQCAYCVAPTPAIVFVIISAAPVLALSAAGIGAATAAVESRERWQAHAAEIARKRAVALTEPIARSVREQRVSVLEQEVLPFFNSVLDRDTLDEGDSHTAREISSEVREIMVTEANRSWFRAAVNESASRANIARDLTVLDDQKLSDQMNFNQRTAVRALLEGLMAQRNFEPERFEVRVTKCGERHHVVLRAGLPYRRSFVLHRTKAVLWPDRYRGGLGAAAGSEIRPYLAVMRAVCPDLKVGNSSSNLTLWFSYGQK
jgi:hypothetical protein